MQKMHQLRVGDTQTTSTKSFHTLPLQNVFGNATAGFSLFSSAGYGASDLLFSDATHHLQRVLGGYASWLGPTYITMLQAFECEGKTVHASLRKTGLAEEEVVAKWLEECVLHCLGVYICVHCSWSHYCVFTPTGFC